MIAADVQWVLAEPFSQPKTVSLYYNGGGYFVGADLYTRQVTVLARYETLEAAIVETTVGKGKTILSGVHFESEFLGQFPSMDRRDIFQYLLQRLELKLKAW